MAFKLILALVAALLTGCVQVASPPDADAPDVTAEHGKVGGPVYPILYSLLARPDAHGVVYLRSIDGGSWGVGEGGMGGGVGTTYTGAPPVYVDAASNVIVMECPLGNIPIGQGAGASAVCKHVSGSCTLAGDGGISCTAGATYTGIAPIKVDAASTAIYLGQLCDAGEFLGGNAVNGANVCSYVGPSSVSGHLDGGSIMISQGTTNAWEYLTGDLSLAKTGATTVTGLESQRIAASAAGTLTWVQDAGMTFSQTTTGAATGADTVFNVQNGATNGGNFRVNLQAGATYTTQNNLAVWYGANQVFALGAQNVNNPTLWMLAGGAGITSANYVMVAGANALYVNAPGAGGPTYFTLGNSVYAGGAFNTGFYGLNHANIGVSGTTAAPTLNGMQGGIVLVPATTAPTGASTNSEIYATPSTGNVRVYPASASNPVLEVASGGVAIGQPVSGFIADAGAGKQYPFSWGVASITIGDGGGILTLDAATASSPYIVVTGNLGGNTTILLSNSPGSATAATMHIFDVGSLTGSSTINYAVPDASCAGNALWTIHQVYTAGTRRVRCH